MTKVEKLASALAKKPERAKRSENQKVFLAVFKDWENHYWDKTHASTGLLARSTSAETLLHNLPVSTDAMSWGIILNGQGFRTATEAVNALKDYYETECGGIVSIGEITDWTLWKAAVV